MVGFYGGAPLEYQAINDQGTEAVPASTGEVLGSAFGQGLAGNLLTRGLRSQGRFTAETGLLGVDDFGRPIMGEPEPLIDPETANAQYGIKGALSFDKPVPQSVASDLYEHKRDEITRDDAIARREGGLLTGGAARFTAAAAAGLLDPINLAAGFIPFVGEERAASLLGRAAIETMGAGERAGVRALTGAGQGAASIAALQPLEFGLSRGEREDYTMADALRNIALGGLLGGGLHAVGGAVADRATGRYANPLAQQIEDAGPQAREALLQGALGQTIEGKPVDVAPALDAVTATRGALPDGVREAAPTPNGTRMFVSEPDLPPSPGDDLSNVLTAARREPPDVAPARADADAVMARPSDELQAIHQQIAELERESMAAGAEPGPAAAGQAEQPVGFTTAKGSTYVLHDDGTTTRNKSIHPEHDATDVGIKERSVKTVYVDAKVATNLSGAGLTEHGGKGFRLVLKDGKASLLTWNKARERWGRSPSSADIPFKTEPEVGLSPVEAWRPATDVPGYEAYRGQHAGNAITEIRRNGTAAKPQPTEADLAIAAGESRAAAVERAAFCISKGFA